MRPFGLFLERKPKPTCKSCGWTVCRSCLCANPECPESPEMLMSDSPFDVPGIMEGYPVPKGGLL
jgi:hypothetical protein